MSLREQLARASSQDEKEIDQTPMLDVVFIMLIFFIVTSSFVKEPGVELDKPNTKTGGLLDRATIIFAVGFFALSKWAVIDTRSYGPGGHLYGLGGATIAKTPP